MYYVVCPDLYVLYLCVCSLVFVLFLHVSAFVDSVTELLVYQMTQSKWFFVTHRQHIPAKTTPAKYPIKYASF